MDGVLNELFEGLLTEFNALIELADKLDHFYPLSIEEQIERCSLEHQSKSSYITTLLNNLDKTAKQLFNKYVVVYELCYELFTTC